MTYTPPSVLIKDVLEGDGIGSFGVSSGWGIFIGPRPDKPDTVIVLADYGGAPPNPRWLLDAPRVQAWVRAGVGNYVDAYSKAMEVRDAILGMDPRVVDGINMVVNLAKSDVMYTGLDDTNRPCFTVNFEVWLERPTGAHRDPL